MQTPPLLLFCLLRLLWLFVFGVNFVLRLQSRDGEGSTKSSTSYVYDTVLRRDLKSQPLLYREYIKSSFLRIIHRFVPSSNTPQQNVELHLNSTIATNKRQTNHSLHLAPTAIQQLGDTLTMAEEYDDIGYYRARAGEPTWSGYFCTKIDFMMGVFLARIDGTATPTADCISAHETAENRFSRGRGGGSR